jgi:hypothetical protein
VPGLPLLLLLHAAAAAIAPIPSTEYMVRSFIVPSSEW